MVPIETHPGAAAGRTSALTVTHLEKRFGRVHAVQDVSFDARFGEITAVLGPNGAGKSTTLSCCVGLAAPSGGNISLLGHLPTAMPPAARARVGVMLQDGGLATSSTPHALLTYASRLYESPRDWRELSAQLGIDDFSRTLVRRLSGGQRQRLSLSLALINRPDVLFLDEPTAGMDASAKKRCRELIRSEAELGAAIILTTHQIDDVMALADRVVVIAGGKVVADGTPLDVVDSSRGAAQRSLTLSAAQPGVLDALWPELESLAQRHGVSVRENEAGASTLEDLLVSLADSTPKDAR